MDASAPRPDADINQVFRLFLDIGRNNYSTPIHQKNTVIKYTKLPYFDFDTQVLWPTSQSYTLQPRLRRIIALDNDDLVTPMSLRSSFAAPPPIMATNQPKRKIVTITEDDEHDLHPKFTKEKRPSSGKMSSRSIETDFQSRKPSSTRTTSRLTVPSLSKVRSSSVRMSNRSTENDYKPEKQPPTTRLTNPPISSKESKTSANSVKDVYPVLQTYRGKHENLPTDLSKSKYKTDRETLQKSKPVNSRKHTHTVPPTRSAQEITKIKSILYDNLKTTKKPKEERVQSAPVHKSKPHFREVSSKFKPLPIIRVPLDKSNQKSRVTVMDVGPTKLCERTANAVSRANNTNKIIHLKDVNIGTEPMISVDQVTEMDDFEINTFSKCTENTKTETIQELFDSLEIPNVTLTKDKPEPTEKVVEFKNGSISNHTEPRFPISPYKEDVSSSDVSFCKSTSYVFSRATLTYTSRQKINFHVVGNEEVGSTLLSSPLDYPMNVVSVFKNELKNKNKKENVSSDTNKKKNNPRDEYINCLNDLNSLNCSYVFNKLIKPSDIISTIRVNNGLLQNDFICEQFQRELNFIDSFFESLQYLESCSLTDKTLSETNVENLINNSVVFDPSFDVKNSEYDNFLSSLENGASIDETETIASKSLCLLNLLIRDEQRRAKNLLFVLKMRENALKDFTKSQILWLEKKKKHDNTDISTLKKKQRGALLKLQHECGEMQRMRKALLTLSEKRKVALMKTKKNIELKLNNNVDVEQIILGKKKLKRSLSADRILSPLKCFDLSSSGCEESTTSRQTTYTEHVPEDTFIKVTSVEKYVQTGEVLCTNIKSDGSDIAAENFVAVDGGYLNILFHDLKLPQIFSNGKQYEVNEEALKNIVSVTNNNNNNESEVVEKLMDQIKSKELETSSPSTARSLVDEFDQYYKVLTEENKSIPNSPEHNQDSSDTYKVCEVKDSSVKTDFKFEPPLDGLAQNSEQIFSSDTNSLDSTKTCDCDVISIECQCARGKDFDSLANQTQTGPLPVPVGAAAVTDPPSPPVQTLILPISNTSSSSESDNLSCPSQYGSLSSLVTVSKPAQCEAEELRRQQLAIEKEIKALEQQQCRLLSVREIPDKPPPPYTPPTETKPKPPRMFAVDEATETTIKLYLTNPSTLTSEENLKDCSVETIETNQPDQSDRQSEQLKSEENKDAFDVFIKDYCDETLVRHQQEQTDKPWDACNLLPQKPLIDTQKLVNNTTTEIKEVLTSVTPTVVSGVSSRRSDHIDDILFAEWRRCEPEWTALHTDEAIVKNQLFESIFQKILTETIDSYKKTVTTNVITTE